MFITERRILESKSAFYLEDDMTAIIITHIISKVLHRLEV